MTPEGSAMPVVSIVKLILRGQKIVERVGETLAEVATDAAVGEFVHTLDVADDESAVDANLAKFILDYREFLGGILGYDVIKKCSLACTQKSRQYSYGNLTGIVHNIFAL